MACSTHLLIHKATPQAFERQKQIGQGARDVRAAAQQLAKRSSAWVASVRAGEAALRRFGDAAGFLGAAETELADLAALLQRVAASPDPPVILSVESTVATLSSSDPSVLSAQPASSPTSVGPPALQSQSPQHSTAAHSSADPRVAPGQSAEGTVATLAAKGSPLAPSSLDPAVPPSQSAPL